MQFGRLVQPLIGGMDYRCNRIGEKPMNFPDLGQCRTDPRPIGEPARREGMCTIILNISNLDDISATSRWKIAIDFRCNRTVRYLVSD